MRRSVRVFLLLTILLTVGTTTFSTDYSRLPLADLRRAAERGDKDAQFSLGSLYEFGVVIKHDAKLAKYWYRKAAKQGNHAAWLLLHDRTIPEPGASRAFTNAPQPESTSPINTSPETPSVPTDVTAVEYGKSGDAKQTNGDIDGAIADFTKAIDLKPDLAEAYLHRGIAKQLKRDFDGAISDFDRTLAIDPKYVSAYGNRGIAKKGKDDLYGAIEDFTKAIELNPDLKQLYLLREQAKKAIPHLSGATHFEIKGVPAFLSSTKEIEKSGERIASLYRTDGPGVVTGIGKYLELPESSYTLNWSPKDGEQYTLRGKVFIGIRKDSPAKYDVAFVVNSMKDVPPAILARKPIFTELNKDSVFLLADFPQAENIAWLCKIKDTGDWTDEQTVKGNGWHSQQRILKDSREWTDW